MNVWKKTFVLLSILTVGVFAPRASEHLFVWGNDGGGECGIEEEGNINLLTIYSPGENSVPIPHEKEDEPGVFTAVAPAEDANPNGDELNVTAPYLLTLDVCKPSTMESVELDFPGNIGLFYPLPTTPLQDASFEESTEGIWIKVNEPSQHVGDFVICAKGQPQNTCEDSVQITALSITGKFRVIGTEQAPYYEEVELTEKSEDDELFFRTLGGMRLHVAASLTEGVEEFSWLTTGGNFFRDDSIAAQALGTAATGIELSDIYWEGASRPDLDETITLMLTVSGQHEAVEVTRRIKSRVLELTSPRTKGDDVSMLQAFLRSIGIAKLVNTEATGASENDSPGYAGTPVGTDGEFGSGTNGAVGRFQYRDQLIPTEPENFLPGLTNNSNIESIGLDMLGKIQGTLGRLFTGYRSVS